MTPKKVELPLIEPLYSTYHHQGPGVAITASNPTIRNYYLNEVMNLTCTRRFLRGFTSPEVSVENSTCGTNPYLEKKWYMMEHLKGYIHPLIRELLDCGYYVYFNGVDDYYVEGKSWYGEKHFSHDGLICGYDRSDKSYTIYAYDSRWIYRRFRTPQAAFDRGRIAMCKAGKPGAICGYRSRPDRVSFSPETACRHLVVYLDSDMTRYPPTEDGMVYGTAVHDYIGIYLGKLLDGSIPHERMDRRVLRMIWDHKRVMAERLTLLERAYGLPDRYSRAYAALVSEADTLRMLYACYRMKRRDSLLPPLMTRLETLRNTETQILQGMLSDIKTKETKNETLE